MAARTYVSYGLHLDSDGEIPGLSSCAVSRPPDVRVWLHRFPAEARDGERGIWYQSLDVNRQGRPNLVIWRTVPQGAFHFVYANRTEFLIDSDGSQVWCTWPEAATAADTAVYLRGPILGFILRMRGLLCLHASAIAVGPSAIAIVGQAGAGKSTTAAGFVTLGHPLLADDIAVLSMAGGTFHVLPGYPQINLWPDAGEALYGSADALPRLTPADGINDWWDKRYVDLQREREFHTEPLPLAAVYVLGERTADNGRPRVEKVSGKDAFMALTDGTYANYALDASIRATEFRALGQLVRTTPVRLVSPPNSAARLFELCDAILDDYQKLSAHLPGGSVALPPARDAAARLDF